MIPTGNRDLDALLAAAAAFPEASPRAADTPGESNAPGSTNGSSGSNASNGSRAAGGSKQAGSPRRADNPSGAKRPPGADSRNGHSDRSGRSGEGNARDARSARTERDEAELARVLAAFNAAGRDLVEGAPARGRPVRPPRAQSWATGRAAMAYVMVLLVLTASIVAASLGALPTPIQRLAHSFGAPAPGAPNAMGMTSASSRPTTTAGLLPTPGPTPTSSGSASSSAGGSAGQSSVVTLCTEIANTGNQWKTTLDAQDQATLIAAANGENKVVSYCVQLLKTGATDNAAATTLSSASAAESTAAANGKAHASKSPKK